MTKKVHYDEVSVVRSLSKPISLPGRHVFERKWLTSRAVTNYQDKDMKYEYKQAGDRYVVSVANREELAAALKAFCQERGITLGAISGIGAVDEVTLRFFNPTTKQYEDRKFEEQMEIANLTGNVSTLNGETYLHVPVTLGRADFTALAGHLLSARIHGAGEFIVDDLQGRLERSYSDEVGLNLYDFSK